MKKLMSATLCAMFCAGMTIGIHAESPVTASGGSDTGEVYGSYNGFQEPPVYSVEICWDNMNFEYHPAGKEGWNPETHRYTAVYDAGWSRNDSTIVIRNHSNTEVTVSGTTAIEPGFETVNLELEPSTVTIPSADLEIVGDVQEGSAKEEYINVVVSGSLPAAPEEEPTKKIGTITLTVN